MSDYCKLISYCIEGGLWAEGGWLGFSRGGGGSAFLFAIDSDKFPDHEKLNENFIPFIPRLHRTPYWGTKLRVHPSRSHLQQNMRRKIFVCDVDVAYIMF